MFWIFQSQDRQETVDHINKLECVHERKWALVHGKNEIIREQALLLQTHHQYGKISGDWN